MSAWVRGSFGILVFIFGSAAADFSEVETLLRSRSSDDRKSGLNQAEILSLDEELNQPELLKLLTKFLGESQPGVDEKFRALEIVDQVSQRLPTEADQNIKRIAYENYLASFLDMGRFNIYDKRINEQFSTAISKNPEVAIDLSLKPGAVRLGTQLIVTASGVGTSENSFAALDRVIATQDSDVDAQRRRDQAKLGKITILVREMKSAASLNRVEILKDRIRQAIDLLIEYEYETRPHEYGKNCQRSSNWQFHEYVGWEIRLKDRIQVFTDLREDFRKLLRAGVESRGELLDYRLVGIFRDIGEESDIPNLKRAASRASGDSAKILKEFVYGMDVKDGQGRRVKSGGAIAAIQARVKK